MLSSPDLEPEPKSRLSVSVNWRNMSDLLSRIMWIWEGVSSARATALKLLTWAEALFFEFLNLVDSDAGSMRFLF